MPKAGFAVSAPTKAPPRKKIARAANRRSPSCATSGPDSVDKPAQCILDSKTCPKATGCFVGGVGGGLIRGLGSEFLGDSASRSATNTVCSCDGALDSLVVIVAECTARVWECGRRFRIPIPDHITSDHHAESGSLACMNGMWNVLPPDQLALSTTNSLVHAADGWENPNSLAA